MRRHVKAATAGSTKRLGKSKPGLILCVLAAAVAALTLAVGSASASKTHLFKETFGSSTQPSFIEPRGVAIDQSSGDVYVMDAGAPPSIKRYNPDGTPDNFSALGSNAIDGEGGADATPPPQIGLSFGGASESQVAIDDSGGATDGNIYVTNGSPNLIDIFSSTGEYLGQLSAAGTTDFAEACGVAVDPAGAVYVGDYSAGIKKFVPAANPPVNADHTATFTTTQNPCTLAAGAGATVGSLFVAQYFGPITKLDSATGELKYTVSTGGHTTVTVDPGNGHVYGATGSTVNEFDASGSSANAVSSFSAADTVRGLAVRGSTGDVYVSRTGNSNLEVYGPIVTLPDVTTGNPSSIGPTSATLNGTVNPDGVELSECEFEYGKTAAYGQSVSCTQSPAAIGAGTSDVAVSADISGLDLGAVYHFRLVAANANGPVNGADQAFKLQSAPAIFATWSEDVLYGEADLRASINPENSATTYRFEWGETPAYGSSSPERPVGSDGTPHEVGISVEGLKAGTTYHYRVVATNPIGTSESADGSFTTHAHVPQDTNCSNQVNRYGPGASLPECRAYEMVTPLDKNNGDIVTLCQTACHNTAYNRVSLDGNKFTYSSFKSFGDQLANHYSNQYVATRSEGGWSSHGINAPQLDGTVLDGSIFGQQLKLETYVDTFTDDLSQVWVKDFANTPQTQDAPLGYMNLYRRDNETDEYEALIKNPPFGPSDQKFGFSCCESAEVQGISEDGSHTVLAARAALTPDAVPTDEYRQLYEFTDGELRLVSKLPSEAPSTSNSNLGGAQEGEFEGFGRASRWHNAVSDDGSRIFWSTDIDYTREGTIYARIDGERTVQVSSGRAQFWTATPDGSHVLLSSGSLESGSATLEIADVDAEDTTAIAGQVRGVLGASEDLARVYFISLEGLEGGAVAGERNLYLYDNGAVTFIKAVTSRDLGEFSFTEPARTSIAATRPFFHSSRVTPDGGHVAFTSHASLTGYDNADARNGEPAMEVFIYDADADRLTCASCNPTGARPLSGELVLPFNVVDEPVEDYSTKAKQWAAAWLPTEERSSYSSNPLSADGNRLFFNSFDALVPADTNGKQDVYEWISPESDSCDKADGCIALLSSGTSPRKSEFVDASPDGQNVFFTTQSSLVAGDPSLVDIYDARVGGGYPPPPGPPLPCFGDACQSVPAPPIDATPASASYKGPVDSPRGRSCLAPSKGAAQLNQQAKRLRARAQRASSPGQAKKLLRHAAQRAKAAKRLGKTAARCRRATRGAAR